MSIVIFIMSLALIFSVAHADETFSKITVNGRVGYIVPADYLQKHDEDLRGMLMGLMAADRLKEIAGYWTPTVEDIAAAEKAAPRYLEWAQSHPKSVFPPLKLAPAQAAAQMIENATREVGLVIKDFDKYQAQYVGLIVKGRKVVFCNYLYFNGWPTQPSPALADRFIDANDGGHQFWQIEYNPMSKDCSNLEINGPWDHDWEFRQKSSPPH